MKIQTLFVALAITGATMSSATTYVAMSDANLTDQAPVVARVKVLDVMPGPASVMPSTEYLVDLEDLVKGSVEGSTLVVRVPGGVRADGLGLKLAGAPEFGIGEEPLLFLARGGDGTYGILHLMLGAFHTPAAGEGRLAVQDLSEVERVGGAEEPGSRDLGRFMEWISDRARGVNRAPDYWRPGLPTVGLQKYAQIHGGDGQPVRWFSFDGGKSVSWKVDSAGQPGLDPAQAQDSLRQALAAWDDDATSTVLYTYAGTSGARAGSGLKGTDGANVVMFDDPNTSVPGTFDCKAGGVLAMGGPFFRSDSTRTYRGQAYHEIVEADVVFQDGTECYFHDDPSVLTEVMAHELGHTLGFNHSAEREALMSGNAHNDGRGARLADDDRMALSVTYGDGGFQPAPQPPPTNGPWEVTAVVDHTTVTFTWSGMPARTEMVVIECQEKKAFRRVAEVEGEDGSVRVSGFAARKTYTLRARALAGDGSQVGVSNTIRVRTSR